MIPYLDGLAKTGLESAEFCLCAQRYTNLVLLPDYLEVTGVIQITLVGLYFDTAEEFMGTLQEMSFKNARTGEERKAVKNESIVNWLESGMSTEQIAKTLYQDPIDTWRLIRSSLLVPNEVVYWLSPFRLMTIKELLFDNYGLDAIAKKIHILAEDLIALIIWNKQLASAYLYIKQYGLMAENKKRLKDLIFVHWPCRYDRLRKLAPEFCEWMEVRDSSWIFNFRTFLGYRSNTRDAESIYQFNYTSGIEAKLDEKLLPFE